MWIYLCSICAREQSVSSAWVAFPARSSNPVLVCLFVCLVVWLFGCLFACLLDYLKIYTFDMLNLFGSFSRNTCGYNLRCCWDSHSWSQTSHRPHPALWDFKFINQGIIFSNSPSKGSVLLKMWSFSCKWKSYLAATSVATRMAVFPVLNSFNTHSLGKFAFLTFI